MRSDLTPTGIDGGVRWLAAAVIAASGIAAMQTNAFALPLAAAFLVLWIAWEDLRSLTIPDAALAALAILGGLARTQVPWFTTEPAMLVLLSAAETVVCGGSVLLVREIYFRRVGREGIGFGDVKLAAVGGLMCGSSGFSLALLISSLFGILVALAAGHFAPHRFDGRIPFGAILAPALFLVWLSGAER